MHKRGFFSEYSLTSVSFLFPIDVNECTDGTHECSYQCVNTVGSYKCTCKKGYELNSDGHTCSGKTTTNDSKSVTNHIISCAPSYFRHI